MPINQNDKELFNQLRGNSDSKRAHFTSTLLTVFAAELTGVFVFALSDKLAVVSGLSRFLVLITGATALFIILCSVYEKGFDYFSAEQVSQKHVDNINNQREPGETFKSDLPLYPNKWTGRLLKYIPSVLLILISLNGISIILFLIVRLS
jgi:hypothetical protein